MASQKSQTEKRDKVAQLEEESKLIDFMRDKEFIYNTKSEKFKDTFLREATFAKIALELGMPVGDTKEMWTRLRAQFLKHMKNLQAFKSGSGKQNRPYFRHEEAMMFIKDFLKFKKTISNVATPVDEDLSIDLETQDGENVTPKIVAVTGSDAPANAEKEKTPDSKLVPSFGKKDDYRSHSKFGGKRKCDPFDDSLLQMLQSKDADDTFGDMVAGKLRALRKADFKLAVETEFQIITILHDAELKM